MMKIHVISGDVEEFFKVASYLDSVEKITINVTDGSLDGTYTLEAGKANCGATWERVSDGSNLLWDSGARGCPNHTWEELGDDKYARLHNWQHYTALV